MEKFSDQRPIGMLDSGVGGLGVARELVRALPNEKLIYVGDTAHFPYGTRRASEILSYVENIVPFFLEKRVKLLVLACNTASSVILTQPGQAVDPRVPFIGVIGAGARVAARTSISRKVGVLATEQTIKSEAYTRAIHSIDPDIRVIGQAAPELVELVESGLAFEEGRLRECLERSISPLVNAGVDTVVLGCTHFLSLQQEVEHMFPQLLGVINPASETVQEVIDYLTEHQALARSENEPIPSREDFYITGDDLDHFCRLGSQLMGKPIVAQKLQEKELH